MTPSDLKASPEEALLRDVEHTLEAIRREATPVPGLEARVLSRLTCESRGFAVSSSRPNHGNVWFLPREGKEGGRPYRALAACVAGLLVAVIGLGAHHLSIGAARGTELQRQNSIHGRLAPDPAPLQSPVLATAAAERRPVMAIPVGRRLGRAGRSRPTASAKKPATGAATPSR